METTTTNDNLANEISEIVKGFETNTEIHYYDLSQKLLTLRKENIDKYIEVIQEIPSNILADAIAEMPTYVQEEISECVSTKKLVNITTNMDSDDASCFIQNLNEKDEKLANEVLEKLDDENKEAIEKLISYEANESGSYMQVELFKASQNETIGDAITKLKNLKEQKKISNIWFCHLTDSKGIYKGSIGLEDIFIHDHDLKISDITVERLRTFNINHKQDINEAVKMFKDYNLSSLPVTDDNGKLIGRITSDDIYDIIEKNATEQLYHLAGVDEKKEEQESLKEVAKGRVFWLTINLITAIAASIVIGFFDTTIQSLVALAILMPIVASMGGNAGTQTLTVTVRQMALKDLEYDEAKKTIFTEVILSLINGFIFAVITGIIAYVWFDLALLGFVIAASMIINLFSAGFFGAVIPLALQKLKIDPAIGSTVLLTTVTDIVGFFSFLGLATIFLL